MAEDRIPDDLTERERHEAEGLLWHLYGIQSYALPKGEGWKLAAMYLRAKSRIGDLETQLARAKRDLASWVAQANKAMDLAAEADSKLQELRKGGAE